MRLGSANVREPADAVLRSVVPLRTESDEDPVVSFLGRAPLVLLGEATHGTHDFYAMRARLTQRLIERHGFSAVAIEGDWPDAWRVNRYVQRAGVTGSAADALGGFAQFPTWMWRNTAAEAFVDWLHRHNARVSRPEHRVGFYGLDLYSLHASMRAVVRYLEPRDAAAARAARESYSCFDAFGPEPETYAWAAARLDGGTCADAVARELLALQGHRTEWLGRDGAAADDEYFYAEQSARLARNAEEYYRTMLHGQVSSWNLRDRHMAETLEHLLGHLRRRGQPEKVVVWAHNSHIGDARATEMGERGETSLGQLTREHIASTARLVGFTTGTGRVIAATDWGGDAECKDVRPALAGSWENVFHATGEPRFFLPFTSGAIAPAVLRDQRLERAIGVIYRPETERHSHYFHARMAAQFDAVIHLDETEAVSPLPGPQAWPAEEVPETFPTSI